MVEPEPIPTPIATLANEDVIDHLLCEDCDEQFLFLLSDQNHEFALGMTTLLDCLYQAQLAGMVPKLDNDWWNAVCSRYESFDMG